MERWSLSCSVFTTLELWREGERREGGEEGRRMECEKMVEGDQRICFNVHTSILLQELVIYAVC